MGRESHNLTRLPVEEEQYEAYRREVDGLKGIPVTIRTFDVGADKQLDGMLGRDYSDLNPELWLRAISCWKARKKLTPMRKRHQGIGHRRKAVLLALRSV